VRKASPPPRFDPRTAQPVASRYTDYATRPNPETRGKEKIDINVIVILTPDGTTNHNDKKWKIFKNIIHIQNKLTVNNNHNFACAVSLNQKGVRHIKNKPTR
jgi:altronate dehydratase